LFENPEKIVRTIAAGLAIAVLLASASRPLSAGQGTGTIAGVVTTATAGLPAARVTIDQNVCGNEIADETITRDGAGAVANAVLSLAGVKSSSNPPAAGVINEKCRFSPHVQIVRPNATITTSSSDPMLHTTNAQTAAGKVLFNVALPLPGIKITKPVSGAGLVRLNCNTHPWMRGWIVVTDEMATISGNDGKFSLTNVPAGLYELRIWHEQLNAAPQKVTVSAGQTANVTFTLQ
jgi:plastocyanin